MARHPHPLIWSSAAIVVAGFLGTAAVARYAPEHSRQMIAATSVLLPALLAFSCMRAARHATRPVALALALTPALLAFGAYGLFLVVSGDAARATVLAATAVLSAFYHAYVLGAGGDASRDDDFLHLSFAMHVVAMFFILAAAFGVSGYASLPTPLVAGIVSVVALVTSAETYRRAGTLSSGGAVFAFVFALLTAEATVALSFLPTSGPVNAAVGAVLYAVGLRVSAWALAGRTDVLSARRHAALSFALVVLVLSTAQWN